ncbi:hypothetical protein [Lactiplantibacillus modestisalitolerans]|uniref:Uncharacterized protein n=1 Tax=Lactiplantibacillus modestisalitolerans TaxID=1457219 RepID=A0ABV5WVG4_9LACO|nr:hypothetical protein [Lactiplantibacillus modestisalitolerans]
MTHEQPSSIERRVQLRAELDDIMMGLEPYHGQELRERLDRAGDCLLALDLLDEPDNRNPLRIFTVYREYKQRQLKQALQHPKHD